MFLIQKEKELKKLLKNYGKHLTLINPSKGDIDYNGEKLDAIKMPNLLPGADLMTQYADGDIGRKKLVKKHLKRLEKLATNDTLPVELHTLVQMAIIHKGKSSTAVGILLFEEDKKVRKIYEEILRGLFKFYGLKFADKKDLKEIFSDKKKKRVHKNINVFLTDKINLSGKGDKFYNKVRKQYAIEFAYISIQEIVERGKTIKKKQTTKVLKALSGAIEKNKKIRKQYELLRDLNIEGVKLPSAKKFGKKVKKDGRVIIALVHIAALRSGLEMGSKDYSKTLNAIVASSGVKDEFNQAIKDYKSDAK